MQRATNEPYVTTAHDAANQWPLLTDEDEAAVLQVMRDGNISTHPVIRKLEEDYGAFTGRKHVLAHCNGTAALLAAFQAIGLQPGDEVLVPSATFWASVLPMLWIGAIPIFCESEAERMGLDPEDAEKRIGPRTRAMVVVHLWGMPSKMTELFALAEKYNLKIIEDASHAHGACWRGVPCGRLGDISVFSLQGDKLAPAGEGGVFLTDHYEYWERAVCLGDITRIIELQTPQRRFAATSFGVKTRISSVNAAIGRTQLRHLQEHNQQRNRNLQYLSGHLERLGFHTYLPPAHIKRVYFEFLIRYDGGMPTDELLRALQAHGCHVSHPRYPLLHQQPFFTEGHYKGIARLGPEYPYPEYDPSDLPRTQSANQRLLRLPSFPGVGEELLDQYVRAFEQVVGHIAGQG